MNPQAEQHWENLVAQTARQLAYPSTPNLAVAVSTSAIPRRRRVVGRRQLVWASVFVVTLLAVLLTIPPVRAKMLEFLQVGVVRIWLVEPTPTPIPPTVTPHPTPTLTASVLNLAGQMTLAQAQRQAPFTIRLPSYPPELGPPTYTFVQDLMGKAVVLVWMKPGTNQVELSLHILTSEMIVQKMEPKVVAEAQVNGQHAVWAEGPYLLISRNGDWQQHRLLQGHVLIWTADALTYRLETDLPMSEAVKIAESLH